MTAWRSKDFKPGISVHCAAQTLERVSERTSKVGKQEHGRSRCASRYIIFTFLLPIKKNHGMHGMNPRRVRIRVVWCGEGPNCLKSYRHPRHLHRCICDYPSLLRRDHVWLALYWHQSCASRP